MIRLTVLIAVNAILIAALPNAYDKHELQNVIDERRRLDEEAAEWDRTHIPGMDTTNGR